LLCSGTALAAVPPPGSAERGAKLFHQKGAEWSCASCHTADPLKPGRHAVTGKAIEPMAPAANPKRLTDATKMEKWFRRNCRDVFDRECTAGEKSDFIAYLRSVVARAEKLP
jgi:cytochrome c peroxidase